MMDDRAAVETLYDFALLAARHDEDQALVREAYETARELVWRMEGLEK